MNNKIEELEKKLKVSFKNKDLLIQSLTHRSSNKKINNERLEFLGDSVLSSIVADYLYKKYPNDTEGRLSKKKAIIVSRNFLYRLAKELNLGKYVFISESEELDGGREKEKILANTMESIIGALFLEKGYYNTEKIVLMLITNKKIFNLDYKGRLQEIVQAKKKGLPIYKVIGEEGPEHKKIFNVEVFIGNKSFGIGTGTTKKEAQQNAAKIALKKLSK